MDRVSVSKHLADNYTEIYRDGDSEWRSLGSLQSVKNNVELCQHLKPNTVIEIGAGDEGANLQRLSEMNIGARLWAVELSGSGVKTVTERRIPNLVECKLFDRYEIPYRNKVFDLANLSHVLEHFEHPRLLIYEAMRVATFLFVDRSRTPCGCHQISRLTVLAT